MKQTVSKINQFAKNLKRDIVLLWNMPIEYLYSFTYSTQKQIKIEPYDPEVTKTGQTMIDQIHAQYPSLKIHFLGSAALKIAGQRDLDLIAECKPHEIDSYLPGITRVIGEPTKRRKNFVEWQFKRGTCKGELLLIDPENPIARKTLDVFYLMAKNKHLIKLYEELKIAANGTTVREYKRRRLAFFLQMRSL